MIIYVIFLSVIKDSTVGDSDDEYPEVLHLHSYNEDTMDLHEIQYRYGNIIVISDDDDDPLEAHGTRNLLTQPYDDGIIVISDDEDFDDQCVVLVSSSPTPTQYHDSHVYNPSPQSSIFRNSDSPFYLTNSTFPLSASSSDYRSSSSFSPSTTPSHIYWNADSDIFPNFHINTPIEHELKLDEILTDIDEYLNEQCALVQPMVATSQIQNDLNPIEQFAPANALPVVEVPQNNDAPLIEELPIANAPPAVEEPQIDIDNRIITIDQQRLIENLQRQLEQFICGVCLHEQTSITLLCGHMFCKPCIDSLNKRICPICRKAFRKNIKMILNF